MKVLLLTTHLNPGGISAYIVNLAGYLKRKNVDVTVVSSGGSFERRLREKEIPHVWMDMKTKTEFGIKVWKTLPKLLRLIKAEGFDVIHAQTRVAQVLGCLAGKFSTVPVVTTCHGFFKFHRFSRRLFPCWGDKTIAISESVLRHLTEDFGVSKDRAELVYNGIEIESYLSVKDVKDRKVLEDIGVNVDNFIVGSIGRLSPIKGYRYLISAFYELLKKNRDLSLVIIGDGPEKAVLKDQVRTLNVSDKVFFVRPERSLVSYLSIMDIFCLPSVNEGLGLSLMEAMAAGRACVASNVGGMKELIFDQSDGVLVEQGNPGAISSAICSLVEDDSLRKRLGKAAREKAKRMFSMEDSVKKTIEVYEKALGHRLNRG
ncbi:MAG: glycosyltransferase family 4 protein [Candidatus Omnitrophica bacterium]|nr:glycosyltransferase family 4 protein [Candidatus Omnitrophota bacterium]